MSEYFEIAYAVAAKRFCLLTGTGFSKAVSNNAAPGWKELLENTCEDHLADDELKVSLFPDGNDSPLQLEEAAQVLKINLRKKGLDLHKLVAEQIAKIKLDCDMPFTKAFFEEQTFRIMTTNYDNLSEQLAFDNVSSIVPGKPIPRSDSRIKVLHVHGSIEHPEEMVVTSDDYFRFMSKDTYFSRKMSTLIHENTVVIFGYSLGDTNLKAILNEYLGFVRKHSVSNSIFFVSRKPVQQEIIDYYFSCYGIRVIQDTDVELFFRRLKPKLEPAQDRLQRSIDNYHAVFLKGKPFKNHRLRVENSLYEIVASMGAMGSSLDDPKVVKTFDKIIGQKKELTKESGAWTQYEHLANWLIYLGSLLDIRGTSLENTFLEAVEYSMGHSSEKMGHSWAAYKAWDTGWSRISADNRARIREHMVQKGTNPACMKIVDRG